MEPLSRKVLIYVLRSLLEHCSLRMYYSLQRLYLKQIYFPAIWFLARMSTLSPVHSMREQFGWKMKLVFFFPFWYIMFCLFEDGINILRDYWRRHGLIFTFPLWGQLWLTLISLCSLYKCSQQSSLMTARPRQLEDLSLDCFVGEWALGSCQGR